MSEKPDVDPHMGEAPTDLEVTDPHAWSIGQFRSTSAWSMPEVLSELGRFNSAMWISGVDVPTAVVVTDRDHAIPARRQLRLAAAIRDARVFHVDGGHASLFLRSEAWIPAFVAAVRDVIGRIPSADTVAV